MQCPRQLMSACFLRQGPQQGSTGSSQGWHSVVLAARSQASMVIGSYAAACQMVRETASQGTKRLWPSNIEACH